MADALKRAWTAAFNQTTKEKYVLGRLGSVDPITNAVTFNAPGRPGYTLVRIVSGSDQGTTIAAYNQGVALKYDAPVRIYYDPTDGQPKIVGVDPVLAQAYAGPSGVPLSGVAPHTHTLNSGLEYYEDARLILTGLCIPNNGLTITVQPFKYQYNGIRTTYGGLPSLDLSTYMTVASGEHQWVLIGVDPITNLIDVEVSAGVPVAVPLTDADLDSITFTNKIPLAAVQLTFGLTSGASFQSDFTDCRVWNTGLGGSNPAAIVALANGGTGSDLSATGPGYLTQTTSGANVAILKSNLTAIIAPTTSDDNTLGYGVGSQWIDTAAKIEYICLNASTGAAVWDITAGGVQHLIGLTAAPTIAAGTGAGTGPTVSLTTATDLAGVVNATTGTLPTAASVIATITFNIPYGTAPIVILAPANAATALLSGATMVYYSSTTTDFSINAGATGLVASTAYAWAYHVAQ